MGNEENGNSSANNSGRNTKKNFFKEWNEMELLITYLLEYNMSLKNKWS